MVEPHDKSPKILIARKTLNQTIWAKKIAAPIQMMSNGIMALFEGQVRIE
jgi:hypothetical protein